MLRLQVHIHSQSPPHSVAHVNTLLAALTRLRNPTASELPLVNIIDRSTNTQHVKMLTSNIRIPICQNVWHHRLSNILYM